MEIRLEKIAGGIAEPTYIFDECDLGGVSIGLADIRTSANGTEATITIDSLRSDTKVIYPSSIAHKELLGMVQDYVSTLCHSGSDLDIDEVSKDNVDESLLEEAEPAVSKSLVELMQKRGYVEGAILVISGGYDPVPEVSYGILTDMWEDDNHKTLYIRLTDGRIVEAVDCQVATDVNKHIFRMVEAEKGRIMENAIKFGETIDDNIEKIIYG
jgi:hypothetical protein